MPNICIYELRMKGKKKDVLKLADWLNADYHYSVYNEETRQYDELDKPIITIEKDGKNIPTEHHIGYRVFSFSFDDDFADKDDNDNIFLIGYGDCAWSVYSCMFSGPHTYYTDNEHTSNCSITIDNACGFLGVECEIFSYETGCCFAEHYHINKDGEIITNEETQYQEIYLGDFGGETWGEYVKFCKEEYDAEPTITEKIFNDAMDSGEDFYGICDWWADNEQFAWEWEISEVEDEKDYSTTTTFPIINEDGTKVYAVPVSWEVSGFVYVKAEDLEDACSIAEEMDTALPKDSVYIDGSWRVDWEFAKSMNEEE